MHDRESNEPILLSIIVLTYNRRELVVQCMKSIYENLSEIDDNYEIIVVDDHSTDGTYETLQKAFPDIILIQHKENMLPCKGMADGIENARGEFIVRIDDDNILKNHCIRNLLKIVVANKEVAFCGGISYDQYGNLTTNIGTIYTNILKRRKLPYNKITGSADSSVYEVDVVDNLYIFRRETVELSTYRLSCVLFPWIYEDTYFQLLAKTANYKIIVEPSAVSVHHIRGSSLSERETYYYIRSKALLLRAVYGLSGLKLGLIFSFFFFSTIGTIPLYERQISRWPVLIKAVIGGARSGMTFKHQALNSLRLQK